MRQYKAHFSVAGDARTSEFYEWFGRISRSGIKLQWSYEIVLHNACLLTHGIHRDYRRTFLLINFLRLIHPEIILKEFSLAHHKENEDQFHMPQGRGLFFARDDKQNRHTIPMPTFAGRPSTMSSLMLVEFPQNSMVGQQRQQILELQVDKFPHPQSFLVWKIRFKNQVTTWSDVLSEAMLWIKEVEMVDSLEELKSFAIRFWEEFSKFWDAGREDCFCSWQDHPDFLIQEEGQSRGTESPEGGPVPARKTDRLHDLRLLSSDWRSWYRIGLRWFFSVTLHDDNVQDFDTRWDEVLLSMSKVPSDDFLESLCNLRIRESAQLKTVLELYDMEIHQKNIDAQLSKIEDNGEEEYRSETSITKFWRQTRENWNRSSGQESKGIKWRWRRKRYLLSVERKRPVFEENPVQFLAWE